MIVGKAGKYFRAEFVNENEIEKVVDEYSDHLFGSNIIKLPKAKISTLQNFGTIPDGFVINIETNEWFIVEAELAAHGTWQHIVPQISKQIAAISTPGSRERLLDLALNIVRVNRTFASVFEELGIVQMDIHGLLEKILRKPPRIAIPIDEVPKDLEAWAKTLKFQVEVWLIEKFQSFDGSAVLYTIPDENAPSIVARTVDNSGESKVITRSSQPFRDVIDAGLLILGQKLTLDYGPIGKTKRTFEGVVKNDGIEIDKRVMSPSAAAVYCMKMAGSSRETANGWAMWKTEEGILLDEIYSRIEQ